MDRSEAKKLSPGSTEHYAAYVGPPSQYDFMGATQFRLACALGLREHHKLLDLGCGSLRAGRLFIVYLEKARYFGIEPNFWLVRQAIESELGGNGIIQLKEPNFDQNADFDCAVFGEKFDFIVCQSIFSHTGYDLLRKGISGFGQALADDGIAMATVITSQNQNDVQTAGWAYPECVTYREETISELAIEQGLLYMRVPWFHPRQDWYLFAKDAARLPTKQEAELHLTGRILWDNELQIREI